MTQPPNERPNLPDFIFTGREERQQQITSLKNVQRKRFVSKALIVFVILLFVGYGLYRWADSVIEQPSVSAQDRASAFLRDMYALIGRAPKLAPAIRQQEISQFNEEYLNPISRYQDVALEIDNPNLALIASTQVYSLEYRVVDQNPRRIELMIENGWLEIEGTNGQSMQIPMSQLVSRIILINVDAVWYIDDVTFNKKPKVQGTNKTGVGVAQRLFPLAASPRPPA